LVKGGGLFGKASGEFLLQVRISFPCAYAHGYKDVSATRLCNESGMPDNEKGGLGFNSQSSS
jgi:hypothetical protein